MLYTLNLHNLCQSYLSKAGENVNHMANSLICPASSFRHHYYRLRTNTGCALHHCQAECDGAPDKRAPFPRIDSQLAGYIFYLTLKCQFMMTRLRKMGMDSGRVRHLLILIDE